MSNFGYKSSTTNVGRGLNWTLLFAMTMRIWLSRGKGGVFQLLWPIITPVFLLVVYYFAFGVILNLRNIDGGNSYALVIFSGMAIFNVFAECINLGATSIITQPDYVRKAMFDLELIPLSITGSAIISGAIWLVIVIIGAGLSGCLSGQLWWTIPLLLPYIVFCLGCVFFVSSISVYLRDFPMFLTLLLQGIFFMTPIIYPITVVPERFKWLIELNPLTIFICSIQSSILSSATVTLHDLGVTSLISIITFALGITFFQKTKRGFADVV